MDNINLLFDEPPLIVLPQLAKILGLNEAIILQQLHYWLQKNPNIRDGRAWVYNSITEWQQQFPFWSEDTIRRTINRLISDGIIVKGGFNKMSFDKTLWYAVGYEALEVKIKHTDELKTAKSNYANCINPGRQKAQADLGSLHKPIPEINQRLPTETINKKEKPPKATDFDLLISEHTKSQGLATALREFIKMRSTIKKPMTNRALKMLLAKLKTLGEAEEQQIPILEQSIFHCWQDIYSLKVPEQTGDVPLPKSQSPLAQLGEFLRGENG